MNRFKKQLCIPQILLLAVFAFLAASVGHAQSGAKATIPFNFSVDT
jgi:hypothetical protein